MTSQAQVLNKILQTKDMTIITVNNLTEDYFFNYKAEFNYIKRHFEAYQTVPDVLTFKSIFPDFDIFQVNESDSYLLQQLTRDYNQSYLAISFNKIKQLLESDKVDEAMSFFMASVNGVHAGPALTAVDLIHDKSRFAHYEERTTDPTRGYLRTGFDELDAQIGGIDRENEDMVIVARTGLGKCLAKGTKVLMADGTTKKVEDVAIGDVVQSYKRTNTVLDLHNGVSNGFKIVPKYGDSFTVSANHILTLFDTYANKIIDIMIEDFLALPKLERNKYKLMRVPITTYEKKELKYSPIEVATMLAAHQLRQGELLPRSLAKVLPKFVPVIPQLNEELEALTGKDEIPLDYLTSDGTDRFLLAQTLLKYLGVARFYRRDEFSCDMWYEVPTRKSKFFEQFKQLLAGIGCKVVNKKNHTLIVRPIDDECEINNKGGILVTGFKVKPVKEVNYFGFMCDGDHRYLLADNTLTHNTWTLLKMAVAAVQQGLRVGLYSGEMTADKVGYRVDTLLGQINNRSLMRGQLDVHQQYAKYMEDLPRTIQGELHVITPESINGPATVEALHGFIKKYNLEILFIDQYSLLEDTSKSKNTWEQVSNISKEVKKLQVKTKIPIISVAQQNRTKNEDKTLDTTQIGLSDRIGQDATTVLMLDRADENLIIHIVKARDGGENKELTYRCDFNYGTFTFIPTEEDGISSDEELGQLADSYEPETVPFGSAAGQYKVY